MQQFCYCEVPGIGMFIRVARHTRKRWQLHYHGGWRSKEHGFLIGSGGNNNGGSFLSPSKKRALHPSASFAASFGSIVYFHVRCKTFMEFPLFLWQTVCAMMNMVSLHHMKIFISTLDVVFFEQALLLQRVTKERMPYYRSEMKQAREEFRQSD